MIVRRLDACNDVTGQFLYDKDAVEQTIKTRLRLFRGEYFRNIEDGTPWWQSILGKQENRVLIDYEIKSIIEQTEGVDSVTEFNTEITERTLTVQATVMTKYGLIEVEHGTNNG